jgi:hypothetical protein
VVLEQRGGEAGLGLACERGVEGLHEDAGRPADSRGDRDLVADAGDPIPHQVGDLVLDLLAIVGRGHRPGDDRRVAVQAGPDTLAAERVGLVDLADEDRGPPPVDQRVQRVRIIPPWRAVVRHR